MIHQPVLQRHLQTISKKCDEHMRIGTVFELMVDGPDPEFAFQRSKHTLDLRQLHVACPQHRRIFAREIAAQQIVSVALLGSLKLRLVGVKREGIAPDLFILPRKLNLHEAEARPASFFAAPIRISSGSRFGIFLRMARSLRSKRASRLRRIAFSLACRPPLLAAHRVRLHAHTASPPPSRAPFAMEGRAISSHVDGSCLWACPPDKTSAVPA